MLYDKRWDRTETKPDVFSLESLIAWLETKNPTAKYDYCDPLNCLLCQYFRASGLKVNSVALNFLWRNGSSRGQPFPEILMHVSSGPEDAEYWTFGAALKRARAVL